WKIAGKISRKLRFGQNLFCDHAEVAAVDVLIIFSTGVQGAERQHEVLRSRRPETISRRPDENVPCGCAPLRSDSSLRPNLPVTLDGFHEGAVKEPVGRFLSLQFDPQLHKACAGCNNCSIGPAGVSTTGRQRKENGLIIWRLRPAAPPL